MAKVKMVTVPAAELASAISIDMNMHAHRLLDACDYVGAAMVYARMGALTQSEQDRILWARCEAVAWARHYEGEGKDQERAAHYRNKYQELTAASKS